MVSIIIPAYNSSKFIRDCLDSALAQSWDDIEIIVIDDGSTDPTAEIVSSYCRRDRRVKLISVDNGGQARARNIGLEHARGEWIIFLDSDDMLYPWSVSELMRVARESGVKLVKGHSVAGPAPLPDCRQGKGKYEVLDSEDFVCRVLYQSALDPSVWSTLYSRSLFESQRFTSGILYEDLDIFYRLALETDRVAVSDETVYFYRTNPDSSLHSFTPSRFDVLGVTQSIEEYAAGHRPSLLPAARDRRLSANFNMFGLIAVNDPRLQRYRRESEGCWRLIREYRAASLRDPKVRLKNKLGILCSYLGPAFLGLMSKFVYGRECR